jgi:hypothetical protein
MDLNTVVANLKQHFENLKTDADAFLEQHLPELASLADKASTNPALNAILNAVHLQEVPSFLETIAKLVTDADAAIASSKAAGVAEGTAAAAAPPAEPEQPADPADPAAPPA